MNGLVLKLLGEPALQFNGAPLRLPPARCMPLLTLLAVRREAMQRSSLAAMLSPDDLDAGARANLRRRLHLVLQSLPACEGGHWIETTSTTVGWNHAAPAWIDTRAFEDAVADPQRRADGIELYRGELLAGFYDESLLADRERLRNLYVEACFAEALALRRDSRPRDAIAYADRILTVDEWREDALRLAMTLRYECGDRSTALSLFERFAKRLETEMAVAPMPETLALRDAVVANAAVATSRDGGSTAEEAPPRPFGGMPFVGRQAELATLDAAWRHAARGRGTLIFVTGEAGIGKTRLVAEFAANVTAQRGRALFGETSNPQAYPYEPIVDALRRGLALIAESPIEPRWLGVLAEILPELRGAFPELPAPETLDAEKARARLFEAMARTVERLAKARPLVLVLEDVHWANSATLEALEALTRRLYAAPVLIVAIYRSTEVTPGHPLATLRRRLQTQRSASALEVHALGPSDVSELLAKTRVDGADELAASIYSLSEGNALFAGMLLRNYLETGTLGADGAAPAGMTQTILARAGSLDAPSRILLQTAAIAGRSFATDLLAAVLGWREGEVLDALGVLLDRGLVRTSESSGLTFAFTHALIENAIYRSVEPGERRLRHRRIAAVLERVHGSGSQALASIARHWQRGGETDRAGLAYLEAARAASAVYALDETIALARASLESALNDEQQFEALRLIVSAEARRVEPEPWKADLDALTAVAARLDEERRFAVAELYTQYHSNVADRTAQRASIDGMIAASGRLSARHRSAALYQRGALEFQEGRLIESLGALEAALEHIAGGDDIAESRCRFTMVQVLQRLARFSEVQRHIDAMRALYESDPLPILRFYLLHAEQQVASDTIDAVLLRQVGTEMLELAVDMGDMYGEVHARYALGIGALRYGSLREMREQFERGVALSERVGSAAMAASLDNAMATCELYVGLLPQALERLDRLFPALERANAHLAMWVTQHARSEAFALLGDGARALEHARDALRLAESSGGMHHKTASFLVLGSAMCLCGDAGEGLAFMERAVEMRRQWATPMRLIEALGVYLDALLDAGRDAAAVSVAHELMPLHERYADKVWRPACLLGSLARARAAAGDEAGAREYFARARAELERDAERLGDEEAAAAYRALRYHRPILLSDTETDPAAVQPV